MVVKLAATTELHKADRGFVRVDLRRADEVEEAVEGFADMLGADADVLVQPLLMGHSGRVGLVHDPHLGPLVRVAAGEGPRSAPGTTRCCSCRRVAADAARAVRALRLWPELVGTAAWGVDPAPLEDLVVSVGQLALDVPHLSTSSSSPSSSTPTVSTSSTSRRTAVPARSRRRNPAPPAVLLLPGARASLLNQGCRLGCSMLSILDSFTAYAVKLSLPGGCIRQE